MWSQLIWMIVLVAVVVSSSASAAMRFQDRGLYMASVEPGATTAYTISFRFMSPDAVGSVDMLFCDDPIPYMPCDVPAGLDVTNASLSAQAGETGFSILSKTTNHIILTRSPVAITANQPSSYTLTGIVNPTNTAKSFSIRLRSHGSLDASGVQIDFGSVKGQVTNGIVIETQVPPMLIFCVAGEVSDDCTQSDGAYFTDMGTLSASSTLTAQSQMAVGTNASGGFAITANGLSMSAGTNEIDALTTPTESVQGMNQFGMNLVANSLPQIGQDPQGDWANAVASADYSVPNKYKYVSGDVVAYSPNVSLLKKFTVSYIVNSRNDLHPGVYSTTISFVASGRF